MSAPATSEPPDATAWRVRNDVALTAFLQSMVVYFFGRDDPPASLLELKLRELITGVVLGRDNIPLATYLRALDRTGAPALPPIMEASFCRNLPLESFARMCHRSLSSFKREFHRHNRESPGRWLLARRLERATALLAQTSHPGRDDDRERRPPVSFPLA